MGSKMAVGGARMGYNAMPTARARRGEPHNPRRRVIVEGARPVNGLFCATAPGIPLSEGMSKKITVLERSLNT